MTLRLKEEDIRPWKLLDIENERPPFTYCKNIVIRTENLTLEQFESLKQQILSEHEIVERLKHQIELYEKITSGDDLVDKTTELVLHIFKSILENKK